MAYNFDPELQLVVPMLPDLDLINPAAARQTLDAMVAQAGANAQANLEALTVSDITIEPSTRWGKSNAPVKARLYQPKDGASSGALAALVYVHGGGFVLGSVDSEQASASALAKQLNIVVLSVDYRLSPEHQYPAALEDCYAALEWLHRESATLHVDRERIGIYGVSAGSCLAAAVTLLARDLQGPALCMQFLDIPVLDDRLQTPSMQRFVDTPLWSRPKAELSWKYYLGALHGSNDIPYLASPARAEDLTNLPPAYISTMEFDPLRDEGIVYAMRLMGAGISVELHTFPGTFHGSSMVDFAAVSQRQNKEKLTALRRGLKLGAAQ